MGGAALAEWQPKTLNIVGQGSSCDLGGMSAQTLLLLCHNRYHASYRPGKGTGPHLRHIVPIPARIAGRSHLGNTTVQGVGPQALAGVLRDQAVGAELLSNGGIVPANVKEAGAGEDLLCGFSHLPLTVSPPISKLMGHSMQQLPMQCTLSLALAGTRTLRRAQAFTEHTLCWPPCLDY